MPRLDRHCALLICVVAAATLAANAAIAAWMGYLSPDSMKYILLGQGIWREGFPAINGDYAAIWPPAYSFLISLAAPTDGFLAIAVTSKIVNLVLLGGIFIIAQRWSGDAALAFVIAVNPFTLGVASFTWSETLFLFCLVAVLYFVDRYLDTRRRQHLAAILGVLLLGCATRYAFGLLLPALLGTILLAYRIRPDRNLVAVFSAAALLFAGYLAVNEALTGHLTGVARPAAPESFVLLALKFAYKNLVAALLWRCRRLPWLTSGARGRDLRGARYMSF